MVLCVITCRTTQIIMGQSFTSHLSSVTISLEHLYQVLNRHGQQRDLSRLHYIMSCVPTRPIFYHRQQQNRHGCHQSLRSLPYRGMAPLQILTCLQPRTVQGRMPLCHSTLKIRRTGPCNG